MKILKIMAVLTAFASQALSLPHSISKGLYLPQHLKRLHTNPVIDALVVRAEDADDAYGVYPEDKRAEDADDAYGVYSREKRAEDADDAYGVYPKGKRAEDADDAYGVYPKVRRAEDADDAYGVYP